MHTCRPGKIRRSQHTTEHAPQVPGNSQQLTVRTASLARDSPAPVPSVAAAGDLSYGGGIPHLHAVQGVVAAAKICVQLFFVANRGDADAGACAGTDARADAGTDTGAGAGADAGADTEMAAEAPRRGHTQW